MRCPSASTASSPSRKGPAVLLLEKIEAYDREELWKQDGVHSMTDWLTYRRSMARQDADELVKVARTLPQLPVIKAAFAEGRLCWSKVKLLASFVPPEEDGFWASEAQKHSFASLERVSRLARRIMREDAERAVRRRFLDFSVDKPTGDVKMRARMPAAEGALVRVAIDRILEEIPWEPNGTANPYGRSADALVALASTRITQDADTDRATVVVHADADALNHIHGTAELDDGTSIASETARRLACDSRMQLIFHSTDGIVGVGRTTRTVPRWLRRQLQKRDKGCRFADCGRTRALQAHHMVHWAHGGRTDIDNLILLCPFHHRLVHEFGWRLILDGQGRVRTVRPDGRPLRTGSFVLPQEHRERLFGPTTIVKKSRPPGRSPQRTRDLRSRR